MDHVLERLSEYIDGALSEADRLRVKSHLEGCTACRVELEDLKKISKMVGELPKHPLPVGFMQRLERKRQTGGEQSPARGFLPQFPMKTAAFAMSGIVICLLAFRSVEKRILQSSKMVVVTEADSALASSSMKANKGVPAPPADFSYRETQVQGPGGPLAPQSAPAPEPAAPPASDAGGGGGLRGDVGGKLQRDERSFTNDSQQDFLQTERKRMGITKILPPVGSAAMGVDGAPAAGRPQKAPYQAPGYQPPSPEGQTMNEARDRMQQMADDFERAVQSRQPPSVKIKEGSTPDLLANPDSAGAAAGTPVAFSTDSTDMVANGEKREVARVRGIMKDDRPPAKQDKNADRLYAKEQETGAGALASPAKRAKAKRSSDSPLPSAFPEMAKPSLLKKAASPYGAALRSQSDLDELWTKMATREARPAADFDRQMVIVVYASHPQDAAIEIVSAAEKGGKLVVAYRVVPASAERPHVGFASTVVSRSELPISYRRMSP